MLLSIWKIAGHICEEDSLHGPSKLLFWYICKDVINKGGCRFSYSGWTGYQGNESITVHNIIELTCWTMWFNIQESFIITPQQIFSSCFILSIRVANWPLTVFMSAFGGQINNSNNHIRFHSKYCFIKYYENWFIILIEYFNEGRFKRDILSLTNNPTPPPVLPVLWFSINS